MSLRTNRGGLCNGVRRNLIRFTYRMYKISPRSSFEMTSRFLHHNIHNPALYYNYLFNGGTGQVFLYIGVFADERFHSWWVKT